MTVSYTASTLGTWVFEGEERPCYNLIEGMQPWELNVANASAGLLGGLLGIEAEDRWCGALPREEFVLRVASALRALEGEMPRDEDGWALSGDQIDYAREKIERLGVLAVMSVGTNVHISWA